MGFQTSEAVATTASIQARYRALFEGCRDGIFVAAADGRLLDANPALLRLFGHDRDTLMGLDPGALFAEPGGARALRERLVVNGGVRDMEVRLRHADGRELVCLVSATAERDDDGRIAGWQGLVHDVTERRHANLLDPLTQLPNRAAFLDRVGRLMDRAVFRQDYCFAVLFVDLDRFKLVNDSLGRPAGDELLCQFAERLSLLVRPEDIVARVGGDQLGVLLVDLPGPAAAESAVCRIQEGLAHPFDVLGKAAWASATIGIAPGSDRYRTAEELLRDAHTAMNAARQAPPRSWAVFDPGMHAASVERIATETALRRALARDEFVLHYQPLVALQTGRVRGFEALLRWRHPERGLLLPEAFLPVAEESGLIVPMGEWVLREACREAAGWWRNAPEGEDAPVLSVNLSGRQVMLPGLAPLVEKVLHVTGLPPRALRLEITESVFLQRSQALADNLAALADLDVSLCLDDFGTGYSTLGYLRDLPVRSLKIDRSFIGRLAGSSDGDEMIDMILSLARRMGLGAVAEGVETETQREHLLRLGCDDGQGFLFSAPVDGDAVLRILGSHGWEAGRVERGAWRRT